MSCPDQHIVAAKGCIILCLQKKWQLSARHTAAVSELTLLRLTKRPSCLRNTRNGYGTTPACLIIVGLSPALAQTLTRDICFACPFVVTTSRPKQAVFRDSNGQKCRNSCVESCSAGEITETIWKKPVLFWFRQTFGLLAATGSTNETFFGHMVQRRGLNVEHDILVRIVSTRVKKVLGNFATRR